MFHIDRARQRGIQIKSLTEPVDTTTPGGIFQFNIIAAFARFERDMIRERVIPASPNLAPRASSPAGSQSSRICNGSHSRKWSSPPGRPYTRWLVGALHLVWLRNHRLGGRERGDPRPAWRGD